MNKSPCAIGIIPARYAAVRFPAKPLVDLHGKSMIQRVWEGAMGAAQLQRVLVATDDERIADHCAGFGADVVMTSPDVPSGTDRVLAALQAHTAHNPDEIAFDVIVNIQGDEPLLQGDVIDALVNTLSRYDLSHSIVATPVKRITAADDLTNPNVVKVAVNAGLRALYFSRSPIPHVRGVHNHADWLAKEHKAGRAFWKHIGLYAYTASALSRFGALMPSRLEQSEQLEQLRLMEDGTVYICVETEREFMAIDTPEDAERVRKVLSSNGGGAGL